MEAQRRLLQLCRCVSAAPAASASSVDVLEAEASYELLGVAPLINAQGHITTLGGSRMPEAVVEAMVRASQSFVQVNELHQKAGAHIARLVGAPAAFVCDGAASGMFLAGCAVLAGADSTKIRALPTVSSGRTEFVISQVEGWHVRFRWKYNAMNYSIRSAPTLAASLRL
jgi:seryl-tRNA(Sec) selenium transferase